uniref:MFS transporter n=1 Tax=Acinetobacter baumannii TaxID=470 RepID=UPI003C721430
VGSFGIGTTEFVIMGLLLDVAHDFHISITLAAWSITAYACGVVIGAPLLTPLLSRYHKKPALLFLMILFSIGNLGCAAPRDGGAPLAHHGSGSGPTVAPDGQAPGQ